jgi:uncharacterized membrane protein YqjE
MAVEVHTPPEPSMTRLVQGIVSDVTDLIKQQFQFAKTELKSDIHRTGETLRLFGIAAAVGALGLLILSLMLVHLLYWLTLPAGVEQAGLPLWACHGIIGLLFLAIGAALFYAAKRKVQSSSLLPEQTAETVKENLEWITSSK